MAVKMLLKQCKHFTAVPIDPTIVENSTRHQAFDALPLANGEIDSMLHHYSDQSISRESLILSPNSIPLVHYLPIRIYGGKNETTRQTAQSIG
jgi:hypothetical protein